MTAKALLAAVLAAPLLAGCVIIDADESAERPDPRVSMPTNARFEPLYGAGFDERGFWVRINSNGCTNKDNVKIEVDRSGLVARLAAVRTRPDNCRALLREGVVLSWTLQELGLEANRVYDVQNSLQPW